MTTLQEAAANTANTLGQIYKMVMDKKGLDPFALQLIFNAANSLRTALTQQGEPVAYLVYNKGASSQYVCFDDELGDMNGLEVTPLYTAVPAPQPAQGNDYANAFSDEWEAAMKSNAAALQSQAERIKELEADRNLEKKMRKDADEYAETLLTALAQQDDIVTALRSQVEYLEKIVEDQAKVLAQRHKRKEVK